MTEELTESMMLFCRLGSVVMLGALILMTIYVLTGCWDRRKWILSHRHIFGRVLYVAVIAALCFVLFRIHGQKSVNSVLVRSVRGQTQGMNANFKVLNERVQRLEAAAKIKPPKPAEAKAKK